MIPECPVCQHPYFAVIFREFPGTEAEWDGERWLFRNAKMVKKIDMKRPYHITCGECIRTQNPRVKETSKPLKLTAVRGGIEVHLA